MVLLELGIATVPPSPAAATSPAFFDPTSDDVAPSSTPLALLLLDPNTGVGDDCGDPSPVLDSAGRVSALGPASVAPADESKAGGGSVTLVTPDTLDTLGAGVKAVFPSTASAGSPPPLPVSVSGSG